MEQNLSWNKTSGGESVTWVGFELLHKTRHSRYISEESGLVQKMDV